MTVRNVQVWPNRDDAAVAARQAGNCRLVVAGRSVLVVPNELDPAVVERILNHLHNTQ